MAFQRPNNTTRQPGQGEVNVSTGFAPPDKRRIVQIAVSFDATSEEDSLYALCDDGSVWIIVWDSDEDGDRSHWMRLTNIPQD